MSAANVNVPGSSTAVTPVLARDAVRWGPIWAGLLVAISSFLLLSLLALVVGAQTISTGAVDANTASQTSAWVTAGLALLAFLLGGFVAGRTSAVPGRGSGLLNGFLVWALGTVLIAALTAFGLGQLFGAIGNVFVQFRALGLDVSPDVDREALVQGIRNSALIAFLSLALPALAASIGGFLGARGGVSDVEI